MVYHSDAFLCLSNLVIRDELYAEFHRQQVANGKLVILDNPVHENVEISIDDWIGAAQFLQITPLPFL